MPGLPRASAKAAGHPRAGTAAEPADGSVPAPALPGARGEAASGPPLGRPPSPRILASDLFTGPFSNARPAEVRMGGDYVIGGGDRLALTAFGSVSIARVLKVDRGGKVSIPDVGLVQLDGLTLEAARIRVRAALQRKYSGLEQFNLEVVGLHDAAVMVLGEVERPGSYLLPSASSPLALLGMAGGPSASGSYRAIRHLRAGRIVQALDLYRVRFDGSGLEGRGFQDGDILFVPLAGVRIQAVGAFRRVSADPKLTGRAGGDALDRSAAGPEGPEGQGTAPRSEAPGLLMELTPGESALEAVHYAGGLIASASQVLVTLQRTGADGITTVRDVPNEPGALRAVRFRDGDVLRALEQVERGAEYVEAAGCVAVPGRFAYCEGMRVRDLLALGGKGGQLLPDTYRLRGEILRTLPDGRTRLLSFDPERALAGDPEHDLALEPRDRVELGNVADLRLPEQVTVLGPLTRPGVYAWHEGMRAGDLLYRAGIPKLSAGRHYAELARFRDGRTSEVVSLDLARLVSTEAQAPVALEDDQVNPKLRPYDQITVYENPHFRMHRTVTILGQVRRPGPYAIQEDGFTLNQLIQRAGGPTPEAMPSGGIFLRMNLDPRPAPAEGPAPEPGAQPLPPRSLDAVNQVLQRLSETRRSRESGALEPNPLLHGLLLGDLNRMVVDFGAVLKGDPSQDVVLMDGDQVFIPRRTDSVYVVGEVASPFASFHVRPGERVRDVLKRAGGYTRNADRSQVRLLKADGRVVDSRLAGVRIEPGDALLVPQRIRKDVPWQDTLLAMTPLAILVNALRR